jgi:hypothetical protein
MPDPPEKASIFGEETALEAFLDPSSFMCPALASSSQENQ